MLQRQASSLTSAPLNLTTVDANILLSTYFPGQYDVDNRQATDGLFLLRYTHSFVLASSTVFGVQPTLAPSVGLRVFAFGH